MKTEELVSGSNSGKPLSSLCSVYLLVSTSLKFIKVMELLLFNGWEITGIGSTSQDNSKMVPVGVLKAFVIAMTMTI